ncbi:FadR/GntR family transcriptional regulator [Streptomyces malaysiensis]|uniref:FadR/GntR family transcriptional regulator n=1 Tax=Streptomyces malaysiensis TaxID=92644 RepID=UPI00340A0DD0
MPLAPAKRSRLVDQVIEQMRHAISAGEWRLGGRIPTETDLVELLGVGRNTIREAVRALAHAGVLEVRQGDGTFVRATSELSGAVRQLCGSELREILEVRRTLEVDGARRAALHRTDEELAAVEAALSTFRAAVDAGRPETVVESDLRFHAAVMACAHNTLLGELYRGLTEALRASVAQVVFDEGVGYCTGHAGLVEAIREQDAERAGAEARDFLDALIDQQEAAAHLD